MESRHLLNLSVRNALDCISQNFNLQNFPGGACAQDSLEKYAVRSPDGRYLAHIATVYNISRPPLSQNPPSAPVAGVSHVEIYTTGSQKSKSGVCYRRYAKLSGKTPCLKPKLE